MSNLSCNYTSTDTVPRLCGALKLAAVGGAPSTGREESSREANAENEGKC